MTSKILLAWLMMTTPVWALTCTQVSGFSAFSCVVDNVANTITLTETINAPEAIVKFTWSVGDFSENWFITKTVTNGTDVQWVNVDNEYWPRCNEPCSEGPITDEFDVCASDTGGTGPFCHSDDFDGLSFSQGTPTRVFNSTAFSAITVDEFMDRDFAQFLPCGGSGPSCVNPCLPAGCSGACGRLCGTANQVPVSGSDTETFWMFNFNTTYTETWLVQTPNFGLTCPTGQTSATVYSKDFSDNSTTGYTFTQTDGTIVWHLTQNFPYSGSYTLGYVKNETASATPNGVYSGSNNRGRALGSAIAIPSGITTANIRLRVFVGDEYNIQADMADTLIFCLSTNTATLPAIASGDCDANAENVVVASSPPGTGADGVPIPEWGGVANYSLVDIPITSYAGQTVTPVIDFNTIDSLFNDYPGPRVQSILVTTCTAPDEEGAFGWAHRP